jgi:hypothetical protein
MNEITRQETEALVQSWRNRVDAMAYKRGTKTYTKFETEFFVGAFSLLAAQGRTYPAVWNIIIMSGRSLSETLCPDKPDQSPATEDGK